MISKNGQILKRENNKIIHSESINSKISNNENEISKIMQI